MKPPVSSAATISVVALLCTHFWAHGCFSPDLAGTRCSPTGECPGGLFCVNDLCQLENPGPGGDQPDGGGSQSDAGGQSDGSSEDPCLGARGTWTRLDPPESPPARHEHTMAYDSVRQRVVLFGGADGSGAVTDDTWEWDGTTWTEVTGKVGPPGRTPMVPLVFVETDNATMLYGDADEPGPWLWDGSAWSLAANAGQPPSVTAFHKMTFDSVNGVVVLFGGLIPPNITTNDTFVWDGSEWTRASPPGDLPGERVAHAMAYDRVGSRVLLFGGDGSKGPFNDTWSWDGKAWTDVSPGDCQPQPSSGGTAAFAMASDPISERTILFEGPRGTTWEWTIVGPSTEQGWRRMVVESSAPPAQLGFDMAAAPDGRLILFGGFDENFNALAETWEFTFLE